MARFSASLGARCATAGTFEPEVSSPAGCEVFAGRGFALCFFMVMEPFYRVSRKGHAVRGAEGQLLGVVRANQCFANDWRQPIVNIRWLT